jgi:glycine/D-amino acid oxidase-like deaminating enzyme
MGFRNVGFLVCVGEENTEAFRKNIEMQRGLGINTGYIEAGEAEKLYPGMNTDDLALIAYEPDGGRGDGYLAGMAFANAARSLGVTLRPNHPVVELLRDSTGRVYGAKTAAGDEFHADTVILTNGCWAAPLAATAGVDVPVQVHAAEIVVIDPGAPLPVVPVLSDLQQMQYVVREPNAMVHAGDSGPRDYLMIDPDHLPAAAQDSVIETLIKKMLHRFPDMPNPSVARTYTGGIDGTPDGNPIIGPSPVDGLFLAVGFSGHGFKLSPGIGKLAADLVLRGETDIPNVVAADFRYGRYEDGEPLHGLHPYVGANAIH